MTSKWTNGRWKKQDAESNEVFVQRLKSFGDTPMEIIKALRANMRITLDEAYSFVVTNNEIDIFLDANSRRAVSRHGVIRLLSKVYGMTREDAQSHIERSQLWNNTE
jgi:hypothetical protein